ncbi:MAG TPA: hypothetical protein VGP33_16835 [Chloroflexota bacterium]|jgi:hypothetical protein|nr:hypothetical protein [Chloroflexota bacterium]
MKNFWTALARGADAQSSLSAQPLIWLNPYHQPQSPLEQQLYSLLAAGPLPLPEAVERLAEAEVYAGRQAGSWSLEVGAQALPVLRSQLRQALADIDGHQIAIETAPPLRAAAFVSWQLQLCA